MRYLKTLLYSMIIPVLSYGQLEDSISLEEVQLLAIENSIMVKQAESNNKISDYSYKLFKASLLPSLTLNANIPNFSRSSAAVTQPDGTINFQSIRYDNSQLNIEATQSLPWTGGKIFVQSDFQRFFDGQNSFTQFNGRPFRIGISQPLNGFNALKWDKRIERLKFSESKKQYSADLESSKLMALASFFDVLILSRIHESATFNAQNSAEIVVIAQEIFNLGRLSRNDFLQLQLNDKNASNNVRNAERVLISALSALHNILNLPYDGRLIHPKLPRKIEITSIEKDFALEQAIKNRPEILTLRRLVIEKQKNLNQSKKTNGIQGDIFASFGLSGSAPKSNELLNNLRQDQLFSVGVSIPILNWGKRKSQINISKLELKLEQDRAKNDLLIMQNELMSEIEAFERLTIELESTEVIQEIAKERFDIAKGSFILGSISATELSISQTQRDNAARIYINTLGNYWTTYYGIRSKTLYDFERGRAFGF